MAIEGFGESLLGEKRARDNKRKKKQQTYDALGAAATIGMGMYRQSLAKKQEDFFTSEEAMKAKVAYRVAKRNSDDTNRYRSSYMDSGLGMRGYIAKEELGEARENLLQNKKFMADQDQKTRRAYVEAGEHDAYLNTIISPRVSEREKAQIERERMADEFEAQGSVKDMLKKAYKGPTSVFGGAYNFITGQSQEDIDTKTINAMRSSSLGELILPASATEKSEVARIQENYQLTGSFSEAKRLAKLEGEFNPRTSTTISFSGGYSGGLYRYNKTETTTDVYTNRQLGSKVSPMKETDLNDPESIRLSVVDLMKSRYNPNTEAKSILNDEGQAKYFKILGQQGYTNINSVEAHTFASKLLSDMTIGKEVKGFAKPDPLIRQDYTLEAGSYVSDPSAQYTKLQEAFIRSASFADEYGTAVKMIAGTKRMPATDDEKKQGKAIIARLMDTLLSIGNT